MPRRNESIFETNLNFDLTNERLSDKVTRRKLGIEYKGSNNQDRPNVYFWNFKDGKVRVHIGRKGRIQVFWDDPMDLREVMNLLTRGNDSTVALAINNEKEPAEVRGQRHKLNGPFLEYAERLRRAEEREMALRLEKALKDPRKLAVLRRLFELQSHKGGGPTLGPLRKTIGTWDNNTEEWLSLE